MKWSVSHSSNGLSLIFEKLYSRMTIIGIINIPWSVFLSLWSTCLGCAQDCMVYCIYLTLPYWNSYYL